jgi:hypothetical protein
MLERAWDESAEALARSLTFAESIAHPRQLWKTHETLARLHIARGRPEAAHAHYDAAAAMVGQVLAEAREPGLRAGLEGLPEVREIVQRARPR